ncbi:MAG: hypothetical protein ACOCSR_04320, partial [Wenzhouxiangella sp.]
MLLELGIAHFECFLVADLASDLPACIRHDLCKASGTLAGYGIRIATRFLPDQRGKQVFGRPAFGIFQGNIGSRLALQHLPADFQRVIAALQPQIDMAPFEIAQARADRLVLLDRRQVRIALDALGVIGLGFAELVDSTRLQQVVRLEVFEIVERRAP